MIHTLETLTVRQYGKIERTKKLRFFKKSPWNPIPVRFFNLEPIIHAITNRLDSGLDRRLAKETARLITWNKILILSSLRTAIRALIVAKPKNDQFNLTKKHNDKLSRDLHGYIIQVHEITGINIKDLDSLRILDQEIQRRKIKFEERYNRENENTSDAISFTKYAYSVFMITEEPYNPDTSLAEFFDLLDLANNRAKELEKLKRKSEK